MRALLVVAVCLFPAAPSFGQQDKRPDPKPLPLGRGIRGVAFSANGTLLAAGLGEPKQRGRVVLWDVARREPLWSHEEEAGIPSVAFSPDGKTIAIAVYDHTAKLLDADTGRVLKTLRGHKNYVRAVAFSPDGKTLATGGWDHMVKLWDLPAATERKTLEWPSDQLFGLTFSPRGQWLLAAGGPARVWNAATGAEKLTVNPYHTPWAVFTDENRFLTGSYDGTIRLWDVGTGKELLRIDGIGGVDRLAFSPRARLLAETGFSKRVPLFDFTLEPPGPEVKKRIDALLVQFDDDDYETRERAGKEMLAVGFCAESELRRAMNESPSAEVRIRCRRLRRQLLSRPRTTLFGHTDQVEALAFSPDGKLLATGSRDGSVRLWSVSDFTEKARLVPVTP